MRAIGLALGLVSAPAFADDYCEHVISAANAAADVMLAPDAFGSIGYAKFSALSTTAQPEVATGTRVTAGLEYKLDRIFEGAATRSRGRADCERHQALVRIQGESAYRGTEARLRVLEAALAEADAIVKQTGREAKERLTTEREALAMRLRTDELRALAAEAKQQLAALPPPGQRLTGALAAYYAADAAIERAEGRLRALSAIDVSIRGGYDSFIDRDDPTPYFAMLTVGLNLGWIFQLGDNARAAEARDRMIRSQHRIELVDATVSHLESQLVAETARQTQTAALIADLTAQIDALRRVGGEDSRRFGQTLWFELVKLRAENAYLTAHVASLREILGK